MADIPTTDNQYVNTTKKDNSLLTYSKAVEPAMQELHKMMVEQNKVKFIDEQFKLSGEIQEMFNVFKQQNATEPFNEDNVKALQAEIDVGIQSHRRNIDPTLRNDWDIESLKLKEKLKGDLMGWQIKQNTINTQLMVENHSKEMIPDYISIDGTPSENTNDYLNASIDYYNKLTYVDHNKLNGESATNAKQVYIGNLNAYANEGLFKEALDDLELNGLTYLTPVEQQKARNQLVSGWNNYMIKKYIENPTPENYNAIISENPHLAQDTKVLKTKKNADEQEKKNQNMIKKEMIKDENDLLNRIDTSIKNLKSLNNLDMAWNNLEEKNKAETRFQQHLLVELSHLANNINKSSYLEDSDKPRLLNIIYQTAYDQALADDVLRVVNDYNKKAFKQIPYGYFQSNVVEGFGGPVFPDNLRDDFSDKDYKNDYAKEIISHLQELSDDKEKNKIAVEKAEDANDRFLKRLLKDVYGYDFEKKPPKIGDAIVIPHLGNREFIFKGYTATDVLVEVQGTK